MIDFRTNMDPWRNGIGLYMRDGESVAQSVTFAKREPGAYYDPLLTISGDEAQQLMDELWRCGIRPTEGKGSAGSLAATERHLEDMRALVAHNIGAKLP